MDKDHIQQHVGELLAFLKTSLEAGGDFVKEQAPVIAQEILYWGIAEASVWMVVGGILLYVSMQLIRSSRTLEADSTYFGDGEIIAYYFVGSVCGVVGTALCIVNTLTLCKVLIAPRLYILSMLHTLFK